MKTEKKIETPELVVSGNSMAWKDMVIQLSNISTVSTVPLDKLPFPTWTLVVFAISSFAFTVNALFGILGFGFAACYLLYWYSKNENLESQRNLVIQMNSGISLIVHIENRKFLNEVFEVLSSIIAEGDKKTQNIKININNSSITDNGKVIDFGDRR